jgi:hypothetical protein
LQYFEAKQENFTIGLNVGANVVDVSNSIIMINNDYANTLAFFASHLIKRKIGYIPLKDLKFRKITSKYSKCRKIAPNGHSIADFYHFYLVILHHSLNYHIEKRGEKNN